MIREWEEGENAFQYEEINGKIKVLTWKGCGICASIPEEINGAVVTAIGRKAFLSNKRIQEVYLPKGLCEIEEWAFACNQNLQSITIPDSVTEIANSAFNKCKNLVISAPSGSYAIEYAKFRNIKFIET